MHTFTHSLTHSLTLSLSLSLSLTRSLTLSLSLSLSLSLPPSLTLTHPLTHSLYLPLPPSPLSLSLPFSIPPPLPLSPSPFSSIPFVCILCHQRDFQSVCLYPRTLLLWWCKQNRNICYKHATYMQQMLHTQIRPTFSISTAIRTIQANQTVSASLGSYWNFCSEHMHVCTHANILSLSLSLIHTPTYRHRHRHTHAKWMQIHQLSENSHSCLTQNSKSKVIMLTS